MPRSSSDGGNEAIGEWDFVDPPSPTTEQPGEAAATSAGAAPPPAQAAERPLSPALRRWVRFIRSFRRIRRLQRIFHNSGERLQDFPKSLRDNVAKAYPKQ